MADWRGPAASGVSAERGLPVNGATPRTSRGRRRSAASASRRRSCWGDSRVRDLAGRQRRGAAGSAARAGRQSARGRRAAARRRPAGGDGKVAFLVTAFDRASGRQRWEFELPAEGAAPAGAREAQSRVAEPGHRWRARLRVVRHRADRAIDMAGKLVWKKHLGTEYGAVRDQLGPRQLAGRPQRTCSILLCYHETRVVPAGARRADRRGAVEGGRRRRRARRTARRSWSRPAARPRLSSTRAPA